MHFKVLSFSVEFSALTGRLVPHGWHERSDCTRADYK